MKKNLKKQLLWVGDVAQKLRALATLAEDWSSVPITLKVGYKQFQGSETLFWLPPAMDMHMIMKINI